MNTTLLKGILKYIGIILGIILGIGVIIIAIMYFSPSFRPFGYGYMHRSSLSSTKTISTAEEVSTGGELNLTVNSGGFDIFIKPVISDNNDETDETNISYYYKDNISGFVKTDYNAYVSKEVDGNNVILSMVEPNGGVRYGNSFISVNIPVELFTQFNLTLKTSSGNITIDGLKINNMNITCGGEFKLTNVTGIGSSDSENTITFNSLTFDSSKRGVIDFTNIQNLYINETLNIMGNGEFKFNNLNSDVVARGNDVSLRATTLNTKEKGLEVLTTSGKVTIDNLNSLGSAQNTIFTEDSNITIGELYGTTTLTSSYGDVKITNAYNELIIDSGEGDVSIGVANENIIIKTTLGNIKVTDYKKSGAFYSKRGNITVKSTSEFISGVNTIIQNESGSVDIDNMENKVDILLKGKGVLKAVFRKNTENAIEHKINISNSSSANIYIAAKGYFKLKAVGVISGEIGESLTNIVSNNSYVYFPKDADSSLFENKCSYEVLGGTVKFYTFYGA